MSRSAAEAATQAPLDGDRATSPAVAWLSERLAGDRPWMLYGSFVGLIVLFSLTSPVFFSAANFANIGRQTALVSIVAVGMTLVIITSEIDLSVGSTLALSGMTAALAMHHLSNSWYVGAVAGLATGALIGLVNGVLTTKLLIPSFLVTLGTLGIARGIALLVTGTEPVIITDPRYYEIFGEGALLGIPSPIAWTLIIAAAGIVLLHFTAFGRKIYATGGNATAARYSGINTVRVKMMAFVITGTLAGLAALVLSARSHAARPDVAAGLELNVIAAVILGGTSLFGGRGLIVGTLLGSLVIGILDNGLVLLGVSSSVQLAIKGAIIIAAVAFGSRR
jgi:ribose transport system permease protein